MTAQQIVQKLWNYCNILRDDAGLPPSRGEERENRAMGNAISTA